MATHATMRADFVEARIMAHLAGLTITGTPTVQHADAPRSAQTAPPILRASFRPLPPQHRGRFDGNSSALGMAVLVLIDLFFGDGDDGSTFNLYSPQKAAADLQCAMQYLSLSFLDYSTPASPAVVADACLRVIQPVAVSHLNPADGLRRRQVRAVVEWIGRVDDNVP